MDDLEFFLKEQVNALRRDAKLRKEIKENAKVKEQAHQEIMFPIQFAKDTLSMLKSIRLSQSLPSQIVKFYDKANELVRILKERKQAFPALEFGRLAEVKESFIAILESNKNIDEISGALKEKIGYYKELLSKVVHYLEENVGELYDKCCDRIVEEKVDEMVKERKHVIKQLVGESPQDKLEKLWKTRKEAYKARRQTMDATRVIIPPTLSIYAVQDERNGIPVELIYRKPTLTLQRLRHLIPHDFATLSSKGDHGFSVYSGKFFQHLKTIIQDVKNAFSDPKNYSIDLEEVVIGEVELELKESKGVLDVKWNRSYGKGPGQTYWKGGIMSGGSPYYCPIGWTRYSLNIEDFDEKYKSWPIVYHGSSANILSLIISTGLKGSNNPGRNCFLNENEYGIYTSPSILYSSHPTYAEYCPRVIDGKTYYLQLVLQCRINPKAKNKKGEYIFSKKPETLLAPSKKSVRIDPNFDNKELEWVLKNDDGKALVNDLNDKVVCYGLMLKKSENPPKEPENAWWNDCHYVVPLPRPA